MPAHTFHTAWSEDDGEYVGTCPSFPSLSWLAPTEAEALEGIRAVVAEVVADLETDESIPVPLESD
ncbi:antitoxin HicB [Rhodococcus sp. NPDC049939]|uniref:antitoxin HicB n=1 Tax=Rhodococcus sp. NPDC049939 TaxID=3155511 RepID=UPI0034027188